MGRSLSNQISEQEYKSLAHMDVMDYLTRDNPPKDEKNKLLQEKLEKTFEELKIPEFIQRYFIRLDGTILFKG